MKNPELHIGCSSYNNSYWKGIFYPEDLARSEWFDYYCEQFGTYEINASFYRFPTVKSLQSQYQKTPEDFVFAVKAPKLITHLKQFTDCHQEADEFYSNCHKGLGKKLGCVLFQLPPSIEYTAYRLALVLSYMNADFCNVIEFRNESWWRREVYEALIDKGVIFCNVSYPKLPTTLVETGKTGYFRMHGVPKLFKSAYPEEELRQLKEAINLTNWQDTFVYFNNTASQAGVLDAMRLKILK
jgi:uncharacterized protein YecE (DUF72 family)